MGAPYEPPHARSKKERTNYKHIVIGAKNLAVSNSDQTQKNYLEQHQRSRKESQNYGGGGSSLNTGSAKQSISRFANEQHHPQFLKQERCLVPSLWHKVDDRGQYQ